MGGKQGSSQTSIDIPDEFKNDVFGFVSDALSRYDKFATKGNEMIMPADGKTNVNVRNPWDILTGDQGPGGGMPDPGAPPPPGPPAPGGPDDPTGRGGGGGGRHGGDRQRINHN